MKKTLLIILVLLVFGAGSLLAMDFEAGALVENVGLNQTSSLDARLGVGPVTLQTALGLFGVRLQDPTIQLDDEDPENVIADQFTGKLKGGMLQIGAYYTYWEPNPNMSVYSGLRYGFGFAGLDVDVAGDNWEQEVTANLNVHKLKLLALGWDFTPAENPNLVFSVGVGADRWWFGDIEASMKYEDNTNTEEGDVTIDPGLSGWGTTVEFGARVRF